MRTDQEKKEKLVNFIITVTYLKLIDFKNELTLEFSDLKRRCLPILEIRGYSESEFNEIISNLDSEDLDKFDRECKILIDVVSARSQRFQVLFGLKDPEKPKDVEKSEFLNSDEIFRNVFLIFTNSEEFSYRNLELNQKNQFIELLANIKVRRNTGEEGYDLKNHILNLKEEKLISHQTIFHTLNVITKRASEILVQQSKETKFSKFTETSVEKAKSFKKPIIKKEKNVKKSAIGKKM